MGRKKNNMQSVRDVVEFINVGINLLYENFCHMVERGSLHDQYTLTHVVLEGMPHDYWLTLSTVSSWMQHRYIIDR